MAGMPSEASPAGFFSRRFFVELRAALVYNSGITQTGGVMLRVAPFDCPRGSGAPRNTGERMLNRRTKSATTAFNHVRGNSSR